MTRIAGRTTADLITARPIAFSSASFEIYVINSGRTAPSNGIATIST